MLNNFAQLSVANVTLPATQNDVNEPSRAEGRVVYSTVHASRTVVGSSPELHQCPRTCLQVHGSKKLGHHADLSLYSQQVSHQRWIWRNLLWAGKEARKRGNPPWLWNPGQTSPEVKTGVSVAPWKGHVSYKIFLKNDINDFRSKRNRQNKTWWW